MSQSGPGAVVVGTSFGFITHMRALREAGFELGRLKTGTPPRLARSSIDYTGLGEQKGDVPAKPFSFLTDRVANEVGSETWST